QHPHRVRVVAEAVEELRHVRVHVRVDANLLLPRLELRARRQLALEQEPRRLEEARMLGELLDRVAAVAEDARGAVAIGDAAPGRGRVEEGRVVRHEPELAKVRGADRAVGDRDLDLFSRAVVAHGERLLRHRGTLTTAPLFAVRQGAEPGRPNTTRGGEITWG